ncbi:MAG: NgoPII family restriction endonuclease [Firmicutes bacterium]|nr:NgoPII family restriction endonuclease [Bacillota bacterium]
MNNLLDAIVNIHKRGNLTIKEFYKSRNRANNMGEALELFICDAFANTLSSSNPKEANDAYNQTFSYLGNQNNPPDAILKNGDAIEVKKIEAHGSSLALNSSYPKSKLLANSPMITKNCKNCEIWCEKDIIYSVGVVNDRKILALCFVYGEDYAAEKQVYERIRETIKTGIGSIPNVEFGETKELGRINRVDPLGITYLRIRGMWGIENPFETFNYISSEPFFAIINFAKYNSFPLESRNKIENTNGIVIASCKIKNPNNPAQLKDARLISFMGAEK